MNTNDSFVRLKSIIKEVYGIDDVNSDTEINEFKTLSEDNDRFIMLFSSEFNVDMSSFSYNDYFNEDEFILLSLINLIVPLNKKKKLTVRHMLLVIQSREWFD
jgi:hypothetical protein